MKDERSSPCVVTFRLLQDPVSHAEVRESRWARADEGVNLANRSSLR